MSLLNDKEDWIVVGLGNPGAKYRYTRHNIGFLTVEALAAKANLSFKEEKRFEALAVKGRWRNTTLHLMMPLTYMNGSGHAVRRYLDYYQLPISQLLIVTDDVAFPFGEIRLKSQGSAGGHNGLKSIESYLGTQEYKRMRMGVGAPPKATEGLAMTLADYVLQPFSMPERESLEAFVTRGASLVERMLNEPFVRVMNEINTRISKQKPPENGEEKKNESKESKLI